MASNRNHEPTRVPISLVHGVTAGWHARQACLRKCFVDAGIDPSLLEEPLARVTTKQFASLVRGLVHSFDDEGLGFYSRRLRRGSTALIMRASLGVGSLEKSVHRLAEAFNLLQDDIRILPYVVNGCARFDVLPVIPSWQERKSAAEMVLRVLFRCVSWLYGDRLPRLAFEFEAPRSCHWIDYAALFPGNTRFQQARTGMLFDASVLSRPMRRDETQLRDILSQLPDVLALPFRAEGSVAARVRTLLQRVHPAWPDLQEVAAALHMSPSTLKRHLASERLTFQVVKDRLRLDIALMQLETRRLSLAALADELGYSDCATFQRAFKSWTGTTPGDYRSRVLDDLVR